MYKDKAKQRAYQRNWVRQKRSKGSTKVRQEDEGSTSLENVESFTTPVVPQSHNPMMVGYVPPMEDR